VLDWRITWQASFQDTLPSLCGLLLWPDEVTYTSDEYVIFDHDDEWPSDVSWESVLVHRQSIFFQVCSKGPPDLYFDSAPPTVYGTISIPFRSFNGSSSRKCTSPRPRTISLLTSATLANSNLTSYLTPSNHSISVVQNWTSKSTFPPHLNLPSRIIFRRQLHVLPSVQAC
jgi:hypothetical protein